KSGGGQMGITLSALDHFYVGKLPLTGTLAERGDHLVLQLDRQNFACLRRQAEREVARAGAQIGDDFVAVKFHGLDHFRRLLFAIALGTVEPGNSTRAHHLGDLPSHVELSRTVGIVVGAGFVQRRCWSGSSRLRLGIDRIRRKQTSGISEDDADQDEYLDVKSLLLQHHEVPLVLLSNGEALQWE